MDAATPPPLVTETASRNVPIIVTHVNHQVDPLAAGGSLGIAIDPGCALFEFVLKAVIIGLLCLLGFAGNTVSFVVLWRDKSHSALTFLLQAVLLADLALVWMLFLRDVVPALGYVIPALRECTTVCAYVAAVTRPLLFLARACVVWLLLHTAASRYLTLARPSALASLGTVDCARRQVVLTLITAFVLAVPLTFDAVLHVVRYPGGGRGAPIIEPLVTNKWYRTIYLYVVQFALVIVAPVLVVAYLAVRLTRVLRSVRRQRRPLVSPQRQTETTQVVLTLCVTLAVCYLPVGVLVVLQWAQGASHHGNAVCGQLLYYLQDFASMFLALNSSIKVIIFCLFTDKFWTGIKDIFCRRPSYESVKSSDSGFGMYKCQDMSEMTLISQVEGRV